MIEPEFNTILSGTIDGDLVTAGGNMHYPHDRKIYQPLHSSVRPLLDPEYVAFHDQHVQYVEPDNLRKWDGSARTRYTWPYTGSEIVEVGEVKDHNLFNGRFRIRVFTPRGEKPAHGWPTLLWFHGGGWACGDISSENDFCSLACREARCVVVTVDYRRSPEHPFPAAIDDAIDALKWLHSSSGSSELGTDSARIAVGGVSAGANVATVLVSKAVHLELRIPLVFQLLVVPPTDNTATTETRWSSRPHAPWLTPARMIWYRNLYISNDADTKCWRASPIFTPDELLAQHPKTWIAVAEQDCLFSEGLAFAERLRSVNVAAEVQVYRGMPHMMMALSGVLSKGVQVMNDAVRMLKQAFT